MADDGSRRERLSLAGSAALKHFAAKPGRSRPFCPDHVEHIPLDLLDGEKCAACSNRTTD